MPVKSVFLAPDVSRVVADILCCLSRLSKAGCHLYHVLSESSGRYLKAAHVCCRATKRTRPVSAASKASKARTGDGRRQTPAALREVQVPFNGALVRVSAATQIPIPASLPLHTVAPRPRSEVNEKSCQWMQTMMHGLHNADAGSNIPRFTSILMSTLHGTLPLPLTSTLTLVNPHFNPQWPAQVEMTTTSVDVRWQDGRVEARVPGRDLVPVTHLDEHDFFVADLVEEIDPLADMNDDAQVCVGWGH